MSDQIYSKHKEKVSSKTKRRETAAPPENVNMNESEDGALKHCFQ